MSNFFASLFVDSANPNPTNLNITKFLSNHSEVTDMISSGELYFCEQGYTYDYARNNMFCMSDLIMVMAEKVAYQGWIANNKNLKTNHFKGEFDVMKANGIIEKNINIKDICFDINNEENDVLILRTSKKSVDEINQI